jgi:hypothetical protein
LHDETRNGGRFEIHIDFNKHYQALLDNEIVIINYLNKGWQASGRRVGIMGCWHAQSEVEVLPERGITVILRHDLKSLHEYTRPLRTPENLKRRSVFANYYTNRQTKKR